MAKEVRVGLTGKTPLPPPEGANFFHFTYVGGEVQMLVGMVNLLRLHEAKATDEPVTIIPDITHRFLLSPVGFAALKAQVDEIAAAMPPSDVGVKMAPRQ